MSEIAFQQKRPDYSQGWQIFYKPKDPDFPENVTSKWKTSPDLPRELQHENNYLGDKFDIIFLAKIHYTITGALVKPMSTNSGSYEWRKVTLDPTFAEPDVYMGVPEVGTWRDEYLRGTLQGTTVGIVMPRGFGEKMEVYGRLINGQMLQSIDTLERFAQWGVYGKVFNNGDQLARAQDKMGIPLPLNMEEYKNENENKIVNIFSNPYPWLNLGNFKDLYLDQFYKDINVSIEGEPKVDSWLYLTSPGLFNIVKLNQENILPIFTDVSKLKTVGSPNGISMYDYTTLEIFGSGVVAVPTFPVRGRPSGVNLLQTKQEFPKYYRFLPWNLMKEEQKSFDSYNIYIPNEKDKKLEDEVDYIEAVKSIKDRLIEFFPIDGNAPNETLDAFIDHTISPHKGVDDDNDEPYGSNKTKSVLTKVEIDGVEGKMGYYEHFYKGLKIKENYDNIMAKISNGSIRQHIDADGRIRDTLLGKNIFGFDTDYLIITNQKIHKLVKFLFKYSTIFNLFVNNAIIPAVVLRGIVTSPEYAVGAGPYVRVSAGVNVTPITEEIKETLFGWCVIACIFKNEILTKFLTGRIGMTAAFDNYMKVFFNDQLKNSVNLYPDLLSSLGNFLFECFKYIKVSTKADTVVAHNVFKIGDVINDLIEMGIDPPFGMFLFKRPIMESEQTPFCRKSCIIQWHMPTQVAVNQEYSSGIIHITIWKSFGEQLTEPRDVINFRNTYVKDCKFGGGNKIWKNTKNRRDNIEKLSSLYRYGDVFPVPVKLNEVFGERINMINRTGYDDPKFSKVVQYLRLKKDEKENETNFKNFYYSTWKQANEYYHWSTGEPGHDLGLYNLSDKPKHEFCHWAGRQLYKRDMRALDPETGPFEANPTFWIKKNISIDVNVNNNRNTGLVNV